MTIDLKQVHRNRHSTQAEHQGALCAPYTFYNCTLPKHLGQSRTPWGVWASYGRGATKKHLLVVSLGGIGPQASAIFLRPMSLGASQRFQLDERWTLVSASTFAGAETYGLLL
jgi:hypothetical protein